MARALQYGNGRILVIKIKTMKIILVPLICASWVVAMIMNGIAGAKEEERVFREDCNAKGGIAIYDRYRGNSIPHCFSKSAVIIINSGKE